MDIIKRTAMASAGTSASSSLISTSRGSVPVPGYTEAMEVRNHRLVLRKSLQDYLQFSLHEVYMGPGTAYYMDLARRALLYGKPVGTRTPSVLQAFSLAKQALWVVMQADAGAAVVTIHLNELHKVQMDLSSLVQTSSPVWGRMMMQALLGCTDPASLNTYTSNQQLMTCLANRGKGAEAVIEAQQQLKPLLLHIKEQGKAGQLFWLLLCKAARAIVAAPPPRKLLKELTKLKPLAAQVAEDEQWVVLDNKHFTMCIGGGLPQMPSAPARASLLTAQLRVAAKPARQITPALVGATTSAPGASPRPVTSEPPLVLSISDPGQQAPPAQVMSRTTLELPAASPTLDDTAAAPTPGPGPAPGAKQFKKAPWYLRVLLWTCGVKR